MNCLEDACSLLKMFGKEKIQLDKKARFYIFK